MRDMGAGLGMLVVETIAKIRRAFFVQEKPIKVICRELRVSRKVVRKVIRSEATERFQFPPSPWTLTLMIARERRCDSSDRIAPCRAQAVFAGREVPDLR